MSMVELTLWLREFIVSYPAFQYLLVFFGTALGGEFLLIAFAFLSAQGVLSPVALILFSFLGTFSSDVILFLLARTLFSHNIISHRYAHQTASLIVDAIRRVSRGNHFLALVIAKFLVGTRVVIVLYADKTDIIFKKFVYYNVIAVLIWLAALIPIGFLLGLGFTYLSQVFKNIYAGIGLILLFVILAIMAELWLKRVFTRPPRQ